MPEPVQIDFCCNVLTSLAKIAVSLWFPNYVLYFSVTIFFNVTANLLCMQQGALNYQWVDGTPSSEYAGDADLSDSDILRDTVFHSGLLHSGSL